MTPAEKLVHVSTDLSLSEAEVGDPRATDVIVLLPGLSDSWRSYELVLPHMAPWARTIAFSQRGHGESGKPESHYAVRDFASDLKALLDALAIQRAVIVGHSSASLVARRFALDHPERVAGLVLEGSFIRLSEQVATAATPRFRGLTDPIAPEFVRDFTSSTFARPVPRAFVEAMIEQGLKVPAVVWRETFSGLVEYDDEGDLSMIGCPTLVVWGDRDTIIDRAATDQLSRALPASRLLVYEGVGHTPHWEDPERFARDVSTFALSVVRGSAPRTEE